MPKLLSHTLLPLLFVVGITVSTGCSKAPSDVEITEILNDYYSENPISLFLPTDLNIKPAFPIYIVHRIKSKNIEVVHNEKEEVKFFDNIIEPLDDLVDEGLLTHYYGKLDIPTDKYEFYGHAYMPTAEGKKFIRNADDPTFCIGQFGVNKIISHSKPNVDNNGKTYMYVTYNFSPINLPEWVYHKNILNHFSHHYNIVSDNELYYTTPLKDQLKEHQKGFIKLVYNKETDKWVVADDNAQNSHKHRNRVNESINILSSNS